ncbi:MAG: DNA-directed RNA polymerase subunit omega [Synergistaceae bacterium]|nr:DNA-directed RNA polymerase subunit omega [Synergistaceae bacterium]
MKFYDIDALENKCGTDNKYEITALVAARARWLSEKKTVIDALPANEKYLSAALLEIEQGTLPKDWVEELEKTPSRSSRSSSSHSNSPHTGSPRYSNSSNRSSASDRSDASNFGPVESVGV